MVLHFQRHILGDYTSSVQTPFIFGLQRLTCWSDSYCPKANPCRNHELWSKHFSVSSSSFSIEYIETSTEKCKHNPVVFSVPANHVYFGDGN